MKKFLTVGIIFVIILQSCFVINHVSSSKKINDKKFHLVPIHPELFKTLKIQKSSVESIRDSENQNTRYFKTKALSTWWNSSWEYRINITLTENVIDRTNWPVDVWIKFNPPAYKFSIRVIDHQVDPNGKEIPYQPWNITYVNETHIASATITFLVNISVGTSKTYSIYWSTDYTDPPNYKKRVYVSVHDSTYEISSIKGWRVVLPSSGGGTVTTFMHQLGVNIQHKDKAHFGVTENPSLTYEGFWGVGDTNNTQYAKRGIKEDEDSLLSYFKGVIFVTYYVEDVPLKLQGTTTTAYVTYLYRFYPDGIVCTETIRWSTSETDVTYYLGGWVFDQDDDTATSTFNYVAYPEKSFKPKIALYYQTDFSEDPFASGWWTSKRVGDTANAAIWDSTHGWINLTNPVESTCGQIWFNETITDPMIIEFDYWAGGGSGADGLVLMFYKKQDYAPSTGGGLGFIDSSGDSVPGYGIEFDNWQNKEYNDPSDNHIAIIKDHVNNHLVYYDTKATEDSTWHHVKVEIYPQNGTIKVWLDNTLIINYQDPNGELNTTYGGLGFSAATGGATNYHLIDNVKIYKVIPGAEGISAVGITELPILSGSDQSKVKGYNVTFFHNDTGTAVGMVLLDLENNSVSFNKASLMWINNGTGGPETEYEDYILWAVNLSNVNAQQSGNVTLTYAVVPWIAPHPTNSISSILDEWNSYVKRIISKPTTSIGTTERFLLRVYVKVIDKDNTGILEANVSLKDTITGKILYSRLTNANGVATFDVERGAYNLYISVSIGVNYTETYENLVDYRVDYVTIDNTTTVQLNIAKLTIYTYDKYNTTPLYNARVYLNDSSACYYGITNESGILTCYLPPGTYTIKIQNSTTPSGYFDTFNISVNGTLVAYNVQKHTFTYSSITKIWIIDIDVKKLIATALELYETSSVIEKEWGENVTIQVKLYNKTNGALLQGTFTLEVKHPDFGVVYQQTKSGSGIVTFEFNTSKLKAGYTYNVKISASVTETPPTGSEYANPVPLLLSLTVNKVPLSIETTVSPSNVFWNEPLTILVSCYAHGISPVSNVNVTIRIYYPNGTIRSYTNIPEIDTGEYQLYFSNVKFDTGTYAFDVIAKKENYTTVQRTYYFVVCERPTRLEYSPSIEIPWESYYVLHIKYIDDRTGNVISGANGNVELINATTGQVITTYGITAFQNGEYLFNISLQNILEGDYILNVTLSLKNYQTAKVRIPFRVRLHKTHIEIVSAPSEVNYLENITIKFRIYDEDANEYITSANVMYTIYKVGGEAVASGSGRYIGDNTWIIEIKTEDIKTGSFVIGISASKIHCEIAYKNIYVVVNPAPTTVTSTTTQVTMEWGYPINVNVTYTTTDGMGVTNANATFVIKYGLNVIYRGKLTELGNGTYKLYLNSSEVVNDTNYVFGTYTIYIYLGKQYYENQTIVITWTIEKISTYCNPREISLELEYGENITIDYILWYYRYGTEIKLSGIIQVKIEILRDGTAVYSTTEYINLINGEYRLNMNTSVFITEPDQLGTYTVKITFSKKFFSDAIATISLAVKEISTVAIANPSNVTLIWGNIANVTLEWRMLREYRKIPGAQIEKTVIVSGNPVNVSSDALNVIEHDGTYTLCINSSLLNDSIIYVVNITFMKSFYQKQFCLVYIAVEPIPTIAKASTTQITTEWGLPIDILVNYTTSDRISISDANATFVIRYGDKVIYKGKLSALENGMYKLYLNSSVIVNETNYVFGAYTVYVYLGKKHYMNQTLVITWTIEKISTVAIASPSNVTMYWGDETNVTLEWRMLRGYRKIPKAKVLINITAIGGGNVSKDSVKIIEVNGTYILHVDATLLDDGITYAINVTFMKQFYQTQSCIVYVRVDPIPASVAPSVVELQLTWGDDTNVTLTIIDIYGRGVTGVEIIFGTTLPLGSISYIELGNGTYVITIRSGLLNAGSEYIIPLTFEKEHYAINSGKLHLIVKKVCAKVEVETSTSIYKSISPFDYGKASSKLTIRVYELPYNIPLNITGEVVLNNKTIAKLDETTMIYPGVYEITITWNDIEPGTYILEIRIYNLIRKKYTGTWDEVAAPIVIVNEKLVTGQIYPQVTVNVDFVTGSERIGGIVIPRIYFWTIIGMIIFGFGAGFIKFYMWWKLPVEVKELNKIIKLVKGGIYEYEVPPRRELISTYISKELGLE